MTDNQRKPDPVEYDESIVEVVPPAPAPKRRGPRGPYRRKDTSGETDGRQEMRVLSPSEEGYFFAEGRRVSRPKLWEEP